MLQIFLIRSQWGLAVLLTRSLKVLPLDVASLKWQLGNKEVLENRSNSASYLAKKERPYSDFPDLIELQEKNGVKYCGSYQNERATANFVDNCREVLKESFVEDLLHANYHSILLVAQTQVL